tara:strand:+ start:969 stop:1535 length:567 start_codon:yes stop_codon:yes gene_type:complete
MVDVKTYKCFPTSIHEVKLNIETHDKTNMLTYIKNNGKDDDLHTMSYFKSLADKILECSEKILKDGGYQFKKIEITNMWGNLLNKGNSHAPHTHSNNILSGVYYLQSGSPIQFFDPRPAATILKPRNTVNWDNSGMIQFDSTVDIALFFPSWLMHWVPPTSEERVSIAWNIIVRGEYGEPHTLQNAYI